MTSGKAFGLGLGGFALIFGTSVGGWIGSTGFWMIVVFGSLLGYIHSYSAEIGTVKAMKVIEKSKVNPKSVIRVLSRFPFIEILTDAPPKSDYGSIGNNKGVM